jgi:hypothetical protein
MGNNCIFTYEEIKIRAEIGHYLTLPGKTRPLEL